MVDGAARSLTDLMAGAETVAGRGTARAAAAGDAIDGVLPRIVVEPPSAEAIADTLAWASRDSLSVVIRGGGTKLDWGTPPRAVDVVLSTTRMRAVLAHRHGDLTATVEAGAPLAAVNRELARHHQWLPLDPPSTDRATIGGIIATNDSGPRRHRYGAPRDLILGVGMARADGHLAKAGGIVVKNVAGYDLARLLTGSFGSLAVIVSATFKLFPLARTSRTVAIDIAGARELQSLASAFLASQLTPTALELELPPPRLLVRFESVEAAADEQAREAVSLAAAQGAKARVLQDGDETAMWDAHDRRPWEGRGAIVKVSVLVSDLGDTLTCLAEAAGIDDCEVTGRAGLGVLLIRVDGDAEAQARLLTALRQRIPVGRGSAVLLRGSRELKARVDAWGPIGDGLDLMRAVKQRFDPSGILNPGRGPGGI